MLNKEKVLKELIKNGNNPEGAKKMIEEYYNDVIRIYGNNLTVEKVAELVRTFAS